MWRGHSVIEIDFLNMKNRSSRNTKNGNLKIYSERYVILFLDNDDNRIDR